MKQRLIASGIVFSVGFFVGLGATYTLLGRTPATSQTSPGVSTPPAALTETETALATAAGTTSNTQQTEQQAPLDLDKTKRPLHEERAPADEPTNTLRQNAKAVEKEPAAGLGAEGTLPAQDESDNTARPTPSAEVPAKEAPQINKWWEGLAGTVCEIDLGRARALTIRKGKVKDGQVTDWSAAFGSNPRIGLLSAAEKNIVTVHGVAVDEQGTPIAAEVSLDKKGKITRGVIALHTQGLRVSLKPVNSAKAK
jgi:hypothetical protein